MAIENMLGLSTWTIFSIGFVVVVIIVAVILKKRG